MYKYPKTLDNTDCVESSWSWQETKPSLPTYHFGGEVHKPSSVLVGRLSTESPLLPGRLLQFVSRGSKTASRFRTPVCLRWATFRAASDVPRTSEVRGVRKLSQRVVTGRDEGMRPREKLSGALSWPVMLQWRSWGFGPKGTRCRSGQLPGGCDHAAGSSVGVVRTPILLRSSVHLP